MFAQLGLLLLLAGFAAVAIGVILIIVSGLRRGGGKGEARAGAVVIIGPFPILVASDREMAKLAVALTVVALAFFLLLLLLPRWL